VSRSRRAFAPIGRLAIAAAVVGLIPGVAACDAGTNAPTSQYHPQSDGVDTVINGVEIRDAFVLGAPLGSSLAAGQSAGIFLALFNDGSTDRLLSITAPGTAKSALLPPGGIALPIQQAVYLTGPAPKIVLTGLTHSLPAGGSIRVTLSFLNAGSITVSLPVIPRADDYATFSPAPKPTPSVSPTKNAKPGTATSPSATPSATAASTAP
jgi:copper(I)-binding protein